MSSNTLFKYIADPQATPHLLRGDVKVTPINELNDPSELAPVLNRERVLESLQRLRRDGHTERDMVGLRQQGALFRALAPHLQAARVPLTRQEADALLRLPIYDDTDELEQRLLRFAAEVSSKVGVFCLSQRFDSLPMWAHYAANATGLVVEFRGLDREFKGDMTGVLDELVPVSYHAEREGITFDPASFRLLLASKFQDWSYEREVRLVVRLANCRRVVVGNTSIHALSVPPRCVARLILGWRMAPSTADYVREVVRGSSAAVEVVQARFVRGRVEINAI